MKSARMSFWNFRNIIVKTVRAELYYQKENGKYQLNLWRANEIVMEEAGILPEKTFIRPSGVPAAIRNFVFTPCLKKANVAIWQHFSDWKEERMIL